MDPFFISCLVSFVMSALCSLPTVIVLLIVSVRNAQKKLAEQVKAVNQAHIYMFVFTLAAGNAVFLIQQNGKLVVAYTVTVSFYALIAILIWYLTLKRELKDWKEEHESK